MKNNSFIGIEPENLLLIIKFKCVGLATADTMIVSICRVINKKIQSIWEIKALVFFLEKKTLSFFSREKNESLHFFLI